MEGGRGRGKTERELKRRRERAEGNEGKARDRQRDELKRAEEGRGWFGVGADMHGEVSSRL